MYNNKPEFVDPDEKNLTYFYHRTKEKKALEKKDDCGDSCDKRFFFGFKTKNARFPLLLIMYAGMIFAVFFFAHKKLSQKTDPSIQNLNGVQYILSGFPIKGQQNQFLIQILTLNQEKRSFLILIDKIDLFIYNDRNQETAHQSYPGRNLQLDPSGLKNISIEIKSEISPYRIKAILFLKNFDKIELEKEF